MSDKYLDHIRRCSRRILNFIPRAERAHYRCPDNFTAGKFLNCPSSLRRELNRFFAGCRSADGINIAFETDPALTGSDFIIHPSEKNITLSASSINGWRYAVYELEAMLCAGKLRYLCAREKITSRIGRILCGPINRPPLYQDELTEETDFYPDAYLNELARSGITGLWISSDFKKLTSDGREKRVAKLRTTVEKCAKFGIKVFVFCIEPIAYDPKDPILEEYPELGGQSAMGKVAFCPSSKRAQDYLHDTLYQLFTEVPGLGGILDLTVGEWLTLCCNVPHFHKNPCPHCGSTPSWQVLNRSINAMVKGMTAAAPDTLFISWPYTQSSWWSEAEALEAASHPLPGVALMHNFESGGGAVQLGKYRKVKDYWLSYTGPADFYRNAAIRQHASGGTMFAKLQTCSSHEIATTGYLPVPALLYRKYKILHELGISGILHGWYFGCYPSLMTRAVQLLSRTPFPKSERAFLRQLAAERWGIDRAEKVAVIWKNFSNAFAGYPLTNQLGYTGPMHDSITWDLHLFPVNKRLAASWEAHHAPAGDRIFDCLNFPGMNKDEFTIDEIITLVDKMARKWQKNAALLAALDDGTLDQAQKLEINTALAIGLIFEDAAGIFKFYAMREELIFGSRQIKLLAKMRKIVTDAICRSEKMLTLLKNDPVLGYHSEACDFKFTAASVRRRINLLKRRLQKDFPAAEQLLSSGKSIAGALLEGKKIHLDEPFILDICGEHTTTLKGAYPSDSFTRDTSIAPDVSGVISSTADEFILTLTVNSPRQGEWFRIHWEPFPGHAPETMFINGDGTLRYWSRGMSLDIRRKDHAASYTLQIKLPAQFFGTPLAPLVRLQIERTCQDNGITFTHYLTEPDYLPWVYTMGTSSPASTALLTDR